MMFNKRKFEELTPPAAISESGGKEVIRAFIQGDSLHVSLYSGYKNPEVWGVMLADIAHHVARIFATEGKYSEPEAIARIAKVFSLEMNSPTDAGTTQQHGN
jgi:hypothetical protein